MHDVGCEFARAVAMRSSNVISVENLLPKFGHPVAVCSKILDGAMHPGDINQ